MAETLTIEQQLDNNIDDDDRSNTPENIILKRQTLDLLLQKYEYVEKLQESPIDKLKKWLSVHITKIHILDELEKLRDTYDTKNPNVTDEQHEADVEKLNDLLKRFIETDKNLVSYHTFNVSTIQSEILNKDEIFYELYNLYENGGHCYLCKGTTIFLYGKYTTLRQSSDNYDNDLCGVWRHLRCEYSVFNEVFLFKQFDNLMKTLEVYDVLKNPITEQNCVEFTFGDVYTYFDTY